MLAIACKHFVPSTLAQYKAALPWRVADLCPGTAPPTADVYAPLAGVPVTTAARARPAGKVPAISAEERAAAAAARKKRLLQVCEIALCGRPASVVPAC